MYGSRLLDFEHRREAIVKAPITLLRCRGFCPRPQRTGMKPLRPSKTLERRNVAAADDTAPRAYWLSSTFAQRSRFLLERRLPSAGTHLRLFLLAQTYDPPVLGVRPIPKQSQRADPFMASDLVPCYPALYVLSRRTRNASHSLSDLISTQQSGGCRAQVTLRMFPAMIMMASGGFSGPC